MRSFTDDDSHRIKKSHLKKKKKNKKKIFRANLQGNHEDKKLINRNFIQENAFMYLCRDTCTHVREAGSREILGRN